MKLPFYNRSRSPLMKSARQFTVSVFSLCFFLPLCSARGDLTNDVASIKLALDNLSSDLDIDLRDIISTVDDNTAQLYNLYTRQVTSQTFTSYIDWLAGLLGSGQSYGPSDNILKYVRDIRDRVSGADNPWWATNSAFALTMPNYVRVFPDETPNNSATVSFPQLLSKWSAMLTVGHGTDSGTSASIMEGLWYDRYFGTIRTSSFNQNNPYTWFDWMADATRSNLTLRAGEFAVSTNELSEWALQTGADAVEEFSADTNKLAIGISTTNTIDDVLDTFDDTTAGLESKMDAIFDDNRFDFGSMFPSFTGRDPTIEIFPESTIGGVHISAVRGSIAIPHPWPPIFRQVASALYTIIFLMMGWRLIKTEYTYWTSLGHTEGND